MQCSGQETVKLLHEIKHIFKDECKKRLSKIKKKTKESKLEVRTNGGNCKRSQTQERCKDLRKNLRIVRKKQAILQYL